MRSHTISDFESTLGNEKVKTTRAPRKVKKVVKKKMSAGNSSNSSVSGRSSSKWEMFHNCWPRSCWKNLRIWIRLTWILCNQAMNQQPTCGILIFMVTGVIVGYVIFNRNWSLDHILMHGPTVCAKYSHYGNGVRNGVRNGAISIVQWGLLKEGAC